MKSRALNQRTHPAQRVSRIIGHGPAEQPHAACRRPNQPQDHPDGGRLARPIGSEKAVNSATRHIEIDSVDRQLVPEPLGQPRRDDRRAVCMLTGRCRAHFSRAAYKSSGATEPIASRPSSVTIALNAVPDSSRPVPQEPDTCGSCCKKARSCSASEPDVLSRLAGTLLTTTAVQPSPTTFGSSAWSGPRCPGDSDLAVSAVASVTSAPGGGV